MNRPHGSAAEMPPSSATGLSAVGDDAPRRAPASALRVLGDALGGAAVASGLAAVVEALWVRAAVAPPPSWPGVTLALWGLLAPAALVVGAVVGLAVLLLRGREPLSVQEVRVALAGGDPQERARRAGWLVVAPLAAVAYLVILGRLALRALTAPASGLSTGAGVAAVAAVAVCLLVVATMALGRGLERLLRRLGVGPVGAAALGLALGAGVLAYGVFSGDVGGAGGPLALFGVLRRDELDLRAPGLLLGLAAGAAVASSGMRRAPGWLGASLGIAPLLATLHASGSGLTDRALAVAIERSAPLSRATLSLMRRVTDRDGDGDSPRFGGGDCDDSNAAIGPHAEDVPANGVDEDCSGSDAAPVTLPVAAPPPPTQAEWIAAHLPRDLSVVVLSIDALRWDAVGFMGNPRKTTPALDRLAAEGVVFERAYALASYTGKSIPPMMAGKYPSETHRGWAHFNRADERDVLLWERLQRAGLRTLSVQGYWYFFRKGIGFERGWDVLDGSVAPSLGYSEEDKTSTSDVIADRTIEVLDAAAKLGRPFFFWTHYVDTHADYVAHEGFDFGRRPRDRYDGEVAFTDHHVGRVIDHIRSGPLGPSTAIIVTADHGEAFGEHGMIRHGFEVWEPLVRVPLLIYVPGVVPRRVAAARSLIDLVPTVLELARVPPPTGEGDDFVSGRSLVPDVLWPPGHAPEERIVLVDMPAGPNNAERQAFIEGSDKLITSNGRPLGLYDLTADPAEAHDLLDDAARREPIVARYQAFRRGLRVVEVRPVPR